MRISESVVVYIDFTFVCARQCPERKVLRFSLLALRGFGACGTVGLR